MYGEDHHHRSDMCWFFSPNWARDKIDRTKGIRKIYIYMEHKKGKHSKHRKWKRRWKGREIKKRKERGKRKNMETEEKKYACHIYKKMK